MPPAASAAGRADVLRGLPLFAGLDTAEISALVDSCAHLVHPAGTALMTQGDVERSAHIILSGRAAICVALETGPVEIATVAAGHMVGEISLLCGTPRTASVVAREETTSLRLDLAVLTDWLKRDPRMAVNVMRMMAARLEGTVRPVAFFTAAARSLRDDSFRADDLAPIRDRSDEIGEFARAFIQMAESVRAREDALRQQVRQLTVQIDETKRARQVAEVTDTEYFKSLKSRVSELRRRPPR